MALEDRHPLYSEFLPDWTQMRDTYRGERHVKAKKFEYLPATPGQVADDVTVNKSRGSENYEAYITRARFPDFVANAIEAMVGIMHHKPPVIELPAVMEPLKEMATTKGESLEQLLIRINTEQLVTGRLGLLADVRSGLTIDQAMPYIALYHPERITNWDDGRVDDPVLQNLNLVVLDESEEERQSDFSWNRVGKYRALVLGDVLDNEGENAGAVYRTGLFREDEGSGLSFNEAALVEPSVGGTRLEEIPFVFINSKDIVADPDDPPLLGLSNLALGVYRGEADYRQNLFMQGQDTLVIMGTILGGSGDQDSDDVRAGAGAMINLDSTGDAKYIGVQSEGLAEQRAAIENDKKEAAETGGKMIDTRGKEAESGDALRIRVSARTASLNQIARAGAEGLQTILRVIGKWMGVSEGELENITVTPNLDFADDSLEGKTLVEYMTAKTMGAPISKETIHRLIRDHDLTEMEFDEEMEAIENEAPEPEGTEAGGNPDDKQAAPGAGPPPPGAGADDDTAGGS